MALLLLLGVKRKLRTFHNNVMLNDWEKIVSNETIGSKVGIIGYGNVGKVLAKLLGGFDCEILAYDPLQSKKNNENRYVKMVSLKELFQESDAISIHVPYSPETHHLINSTTLNLMKPDVIIVNTARGKIIDEKALYQALKDGRIGGAGLDVFENEPLRMDSPLLGLENVILTPHIASQTIQSLWNIYKTAIDIAAEYFERGDSSFIVNKDYKENQIEY